MAGDGAGERDTRHGRRFGKGSFYKWIECTVFIVPTGDLKVWAQGHLGTDIIFSSGSTAHT